jgi:MFS family permease
VDACILVFAGLLLAAGNLGDRYGRKRALQLGLLVFGLASAAGAFATGGGQVIAARAAMGIGAR